MPLGPLIFASALSLLVSLLTGGRVPRVWRAAMLTEAVTALGAAGVVLAGGGEWEWRSGFLIGGEAVHLRFDAISALFMALLAVVCGVGSVYAGGYWSDSRHPRSAPLGRL